LGTDRKYQTIIKEQDKLDQDKPATANNPAGGEPIVIPVYPSGMPEGGVKRQRGRPKKIRQEDSEQVLSKSPNSQTSNKSVNDADMTPEKLDDEDKNGVSKELFKKDEVEEKMEVDQDETPNNQEIEENVSNNVNKVEIPKVEETGADEAKVIDLT